jgi:hypothetical protein
MYLLTSSEVIEPPLPPVASPAAAGTKSRPKNAKPKANVYYWCIMAMFVVSLIMRVAMIIRSLL